MLSWRKCVIFIFQTADTFCVLMHTVSTQTECYRMWVLPFQHRSLVTYPVTFLGSSVLNNTFTFPSFSLLPLNTPFLFHLRSVSLAFLAPITSPFEIAFLAVVFTLSNGTKACFWKAVWSLTSSCISLPSSVFLQFSCLLNSSLVTRCLFHLVTPHLQHYPFYWYYCPDYNHPEAIEDL